MSSVSNLMFLVIYYKQQKQFVWLREIHGKSTTWYYDTKIETGIAKTVECLQQSAILIIPVIEGHQTAFNGI